MVIVNAEGGGMHSWRLVYVENFGANLRICCYHAMHHDHAP